MKRHVPVHRLLKWGRLLPFFFLYQSVGCLPEGAIQQVFAENVVFTAGIIIQTVTSIVFNTIFGVA